MDIRHEDIGTVCITDSEESPIFTKNCEGFPLLAVWAKETRNPLSVWSRGTGGPNDSGFDGGSER
jgi:hypothetical protein